MATIKGLTLEINGETTPLQRALSGVNKTSKDLQSELRDIEKLLKLDPENTELLAQRQKVLSKSVENTAEKLEILQESARQAAEQLERGEIGEEQFRALQREIIKTERSLRNYEQQLDNTGDETKDLKNQTDNAKKSALDFDDVLAANVMGDIAVDAAKELARAMSELSRQMDSATGKIRGKLGATAEEAERLTEVARGVWRKGFGEDITDVTDNLAIVKQFLGDISDKELSNILENAYTIRDLFGADIFESVRSVKTLMQNFGITSNEAFDLITVGYQKGLDFSGELLDTINEYSVQFATMGLTAEESFNLIKQGSAEGAFNVDKIADAMKEFNIRIKDGSKTTEEGLESLGINYQEMIKKLGDGSLTSYDAMQMVIDKLKQTDDKVLQNQAGVALFGTQWEDTGSQVVLSLGNIETSIDDVTDATKEAGDAARDNIDQRFIESLRNLQSALKPISDQVLDWVSQLMQEIAMAIDYIDRFIKFIIDTISNVKEKLKELVESVKSMVDNIKEAFSNADWSSIGSNIVKGIIEGFLGTSKKTNYKALSKGILNGFKLALGIHSPSTVFRDEIGKNIALGIDEGIKENEKTVIKTVGDLSKHILNEAISWVDDKKFYNQLALKDEIVFWEDLKNMAGLQATEISQIDKKIYTAKKSLSDQAAKEQQEFENSVKSRTDSLKSFAGIFDDITNDTKISGQELLNNLENQVKAFDDWQNNLQKLSARGISGALLEELQSAGPKAAKELEALTSLSDDELTKYANLFKLKSQMATSQALAELSPLQQAIQTTATSLSAMSSEIATMGGNISYSLADTTDYTKEDTQETMISKIAEAVQAAVTQSIMTGLQYVGDSIFDAIPKQANFNVDSKKVAQVTWGANDDEGERRGRIFAPSRDQIAAIAMSVMPKPL